MQVITPLHVLYVVLWIVTMAAALVLQQSILNKGNVRIAWVLPTLSFALSVVLSIPNFITAWRVYFSLPAFAASVVIFFFLNLSTIAFILMYVDWWRTHNRRRRAKNPTQRKTVKRKGTFSFSTRKKKMQTPRKKRTKKDEA